MSDTERAVLIFTEESTLAPTELVAWVLVVVCVFAVVLVAVLVFRLQSAVSFDPLELELLRLLFELDELLELV